VSSVRDNLIAARALIDTPEKWVKGNYLRGGCLCALGAARLACFGVVHGDDVDDRNPVAIALKQQLSAEWHGSVDDFNDDRDTTHADIMVLFDRAIAACTTEQVQS